MPSNKVRDPAQVYAPQGYDLVVDTPDIAAASPERVELIFERHGETASRLGMPMLVGEWGAYGRNPGTLPAARHVVYQFEKLLCSETYWAYEPGIETFPCFAALHRPYPERIAGTLLSYHYDNLQDVFSCTWQEHGNMSAPTRIYLPDWLYDKKTEIVISPEGLGCEIVEISTDSNNCYLVVPPITYARKRTLIIKGNK